jgi:hypothetical protein
MSTELQATASSAWIGPKGGIVRTHDIREPDAGNRTDYTALGLARPGSEREQDQSHVYQPPHGCERGKWFWTMTATHPDPRFPVLTNGTEEKCGDTGRHVIKCDQRMASFYGVSQLGAQCYLPRLTP